MGTFGATRTVGPGNIVVAHDNLQATASSATILLAPLTYSGSDAHLVLFHPNVDRFTVFSRGEFTTRVADPIVNIYLVYAANGNVIPNVGDTSIASDGTYITRRAFDGFGSPDITLDVTVATAPKDSTYKYSPNTLNAFYNTKAGYLTAATDPGGMTSSFIWRDGAIGCLVLTQTAGNVSGGNDTLQALVLAYGAGV